MSERAASAPPLLTEPVEDYLKAIYELETRFGAAATSDVANALDVAPASVTGMIRRLATQGFLDHVPYRGVQLTQAGRQAALRTIRRHRILETYLTRVLGYPWDRVHDEAERLEHAASDHLIDRMAAALGNPTEDPHGAPIPTADGVVDERVHRTLADLAVGESARMVRVSDKDPSLLRYLAEIALQPGAEITLVDRAPFDGPITLRVGAQEPVVGPNLAAQVLVESMSASATAAHAVSAAPAAASSSVAADVPSVERPRTRKSSR
ncbi:metal-dependent transcriptional regulator [Gemmatimonas phototrophica]|uniref:metal-dependent transcriptional regulator n=1 Tax=Gemmatimonas phototrophica TaxID=1379270 RepID=UPI0009EDD285|nr:metal-dependent transcriptional regulator [Gemmatimonas phototrophica]